ncbi:MAG: hypothetical protein A2163_06575 [Actinobacteria bacterium RBG_13_35_12]|nr:MAG: hypothetical protein A2163_06575 [Actinobacteria bacterium RBG_13_35_12]
MVQSGKVKNIGFFLAIFMLILGIYLGVFHSGCTLVSFAQETVDTAETGETVETEAAQEAPTTEEAVNTEETAIAEEELDISLTAEYITYEKVNEEDLIIANDGVQLKYQDIEIKAEYLKINLTTHLLFASGEGGVFFKQDETETNCEELTYNWKTKKIILLRLKGELTGEGIEGKVYYQGEKMENFPETVELTGGSFTTCELEEPHYHIVAKEMIIYPKNKIIARNISWYEGKTKIITLPYFLIFLDHKTQMPILPKIGQNSADGWFVKTNFNYYIDEKSYGTLYIDWLERKGFGIGVEHTWEIGSQDYPGETTLYLYQIKEKDSGQISLTGKVKYGQEFEDNIKTQVTLDYSGMKAEGGGLLSNSLKSQFSLDKQGEKYNLNISGRYNFSGKDMENLSIDGNVTIKHNYTFSDNLNSALTLVYTDKNPAGQEAADLELEPKWELKYRGEGYTLSLTTEKRFDLDGDNYTGENVSKIIDRLPEFVFNKSAAVIGDTKITYDIDASVAHFYEAASEEDNWRGEYIINAKRPFNFGEHFTLTPSGIFRQDVYLTGEARYLVGGKVDLKVVYNPYISSTLSYNYNKSVGPTPFNFDYITPLTNTASGKLTLTPTEKIKLDLSTNYNFVTENFGNLVAKLEYNPKEDWKMNFSSSYNLNTKEWTKKINSTLDLQLSDDWSIKYKGVVDLEDFKLTNSVVGITRDLHCREITINYKQASKSFWVEFYIKAFPTEKITLGGE